MMDKIAQTCGPATIRIDVSKAVLDVHLHPEGLRQRFANDGAGHAFLISWTASHQPERVIFEANGAYHRALETACLMLNPASEVLRSHGPPRHLWRAVAAVGSQMARVVMDRSRV